jgi:hypothetical protein
VSLSVNFILRLNSRSFYSAPVPKKLEASSAKNTKMEKTSYIQDESRFLWDMFEDEMAWDKLHEGIRGFAKDGQFRALTIRWHELMRDRRGAQGDAQGEASGVRGCSVAGDSRMHGCDLQGISGPVSKD